MRQRALQGAGLWLSMVRAVCQAHGGTVEVRSEEEVGATVRVELPLVTRNNP
ncbi:MAG: ATP-binding protein [Syntrophobacteraceae bacterium]